MRGATGVPSARIAWLNYHSKFNTGLPDYWLLVVRERPNKWGLPYFAVGTCPRCGNASVISEMKYPNRTRELKHNCRTCGIVDVG